MTNAASEKSIPVEDTPEDTSPETQNAAEADPVALLTEQVKKQEEEISRLKDQYLRAVAETENVRTRAKRDMDEVGKYAATKFARDVVSIVENLDRAAQSISPEARAGNSVLKNVGDGIDMTKQEVLTIFERHGIKRVHPLGEKFDHNLHQAVSQQESAEAAPGTVLQVLQAGYTLHDRLLKPAMVIVSTKMAGAKTDGSA